jgi:hypothetical protein
MLVGIREGLRELMADAIRHVVYGTAPFESKYGGPKQVVVSPAFIPSRIVVSTITVSVGDLRARRGEYQVDLALLVRCWRWMHGAVVEPTDELIL